MSNGDIHNDSFEFKVGYEDGLKWGNYDYNRRPGPEYDAGFMAGYFQKYGRTFEDKTYRQLESERKAKANQENVFYAKTLFGDATPLSVKLAAFIKSIVVFFIIVLIASVSSLFGGDKTSDKTDNQSTQPVQNEAYHNEHPIMNSDNTRVLNETELNELRNKYLDDVADKLNLNWNASSVSSSGSVEVKFKLDRNGQLLSSEVTKSSGNVQFDNAAIRVLEKSAPFKPFPQELSNSYVNIKFIFWGK